MKHLYYCLSVVAILISYSCTREMVTELEDLLLEASTTYFISPNGNDNNSGNSPEEAWKTISKLNATEFIPGSKILFEGGAVFHGNLQLTREDANNDAKPVLISSYGNGKATIMAGNSFGISAHNTAGIKIDNLIIAGSGMHTNTSSGIKFFNDLPGDVKLEKVIITNSEIYGFREFGIEIGANKGNSGFNNVLIENNKVYDCLDAGISSYGFFSKTKSGYAHSNITVRNCEVYNIEGYNKGEHSGNGIVLSNVQNSVIEYCTVYDCGKGNTNCGGPVGIWYWDADHVTIQHSEAYNISSGTGCDGGGFDMDGGVTNGIMQYNYSHNNDGAGFLVGQFTGARPMNNIIVRYNISENDAATNGGSVYLFNGDTHMNNIHIYNNTLYIDDQQSGESPAGIKYLEWNQIKGNINIWNNIIYANKGAALISVPVGYTANLKGNLYHSNDQWKIQYHGTTFTTLNQFRTTTGQEIYNNQPTGYQGDPGLTAAGNGGVIGFGEDLGILQAYRLFDDSPAKDKGINLSVAIGERDYFGNPPLRDTRQDIGAHEL